MPLPRSFNDLPCRTHARPMPAFDPEEPSVPSTQSHTSVVYQPRSGETWRDPFPMYKALRDHDPVHRFENDAGEEIWALARFRDVFDAAVDASSRRATSCDCAR